MNADEKIWRYLKSAGLNDFGVAGLMGNLFAESGLNPKNLQNTYEKKLGMTDEEYTAAVDSGSYSNFVKDSAGYGLAQWTYWSRKDALLASCKAAGASVGDMDAQLNFLLLPPAVVVLQVEDDALYALLPCQQLLLQIRLDAGSRPLAYPRQLRMQRSVRVVLPCAPVNA